MSASRFWALAPVLWIAACSDGAPPALPVAAPPDVAPVVEVLPPATGLDEPLPPFDEISDELIIHSGKLRGAAGEVRLYRIPDGEALLRFEGLQLDRAAGVEVRLAASTGANADGATLGALKAASGNFNYYVEPELAQAGYRTVLLYDPAAGTALASAGLK